MDCLSPILDIGTRLWDCSSKHVAYIHHLEENTQKLRAKLDELDGCRRDILRKVEVAEQQPRTRRTEDVKLWLARAEATYDEVNAIVEEGEKELRNKCAGNCCPKNTRSAYKIGKRVVQKIDYVVELRDKAGPFYCSDSAIVLRLPRKCLLIPKWPLENTVGLDSKVEKVRKAIEDENVRIIRLCGQGGVGKTTLLKKVSNEFHSQSHDFDAVIWAKVPREEGYIEKVQEVIRKKLDIPDEIWNQCSCKDEKGAQIYSVLNGKKFVLLLDNVWEWFDLPGLGIHLRDNQNQSKVIFTARSLGLSLYDIKAQVTIEVKCLPQEQALSLFRMTVGESVLSSDPNLWELENTFVRKCGGLPLALLTVARATACRNSLREWRHTIELLHTYPSEIADMGAYVFPLLKFSYDNLNEPNAQNCFLYCSVFPEDYNIRIDELIDLWIGEGLLDGSNPCDQGTFTLGTLKLAYLLETDESKQYVRMHDIFRHMALWLARDQGRKKNKVLVSKNGRLTEQEITKWEEANWISLFGCISTKVNISRSPSCPHLTTLLLRDGQLESFPGGFFNSMPALKVLDLSGNRSLVELPSNIENAQTLQYLNLSFTRLAELPTTLRNLRNLRCLLLDYTVSLKWVPKEVICNLLLLQVYSKINEVTEYSVESRPSDEIAFLEVLECLNHINKIGITIFSAPSLGKLLQSHTLRNCIRKVAFMECTDLVSLHFTEELSNLESLEIWHSSLREVKVSEGCKLGNLTKVCIGVCPLLVNLNSLAYARNLESLKILDCKSLKEVTSEKIAFPMLKTISLSRLLILTRIGPSSSCFPSLLEIEVTKCPWLRQLPLDLESANFVQKIVGETEWWDDLIWDDEAVKDVCRLKLVSTAFELLEKAQPSQACDIVYHQASSSDNRLPSKSSCWISPPRTPLPSKCYILPNYLPPRAESFAEILTESGTFNKQRVPSKKMKQQSVQIVSGSTAEPATLTKALNLDDMDAIKVIGEGNGKTLQLVKHKLTGQFFVLQIIEKNIEESARKQIANELKIHESSQCPYVVASYHSLYNNGAISIILEYMDGGSLADFLKKVKSVPEPYLAAICKQALKGLIYLHREAHILHRDLKPSKLLINHSGEVKITDFRISARLMSFSERANTFVGTYNYMSPERIVGDSYGVNADIWSLGIVLLECATGKFPYTPPDQAEEWHNFYELMECIVEQPAPCAPSDQFSPEFCSFIAACLQKDPKERKFANELLELPFLKMYDDVEVDLSSYFSSAGSPFATH